MITIYSTFSIAILSYVYFIIFLLLLLLLFFLIVCILSASEWILSRYTALYK